MGCELESAANVQEDNPNFEYYSQYESMQIAQMNAMRNGNNNNNNTTNIHQNQSRSQNLGRGPNIKNNDEEFNNPNDLRKKTLLGRLNPNTGFKDALITSQSQLDNSLRDHIPTYFPSSENPNIPIPNTKDDFITRSITVDFTKYYIIAVNGINMVDRVAEENGNYVIYHDSKPCRNDKYTAMIVRKINGNPEIRFSPEKPKGFEI